MSFYLDASVLVPVLVMQEASAAVESFLSAAGDPLIISDFAAAEVSSAIGRLVRMGFLPGEAATNLLDEFDAWRASDCDGVDFQAADLRLARLFMRQFDLGLRAPDALHAAVCRREGFTLVALDQRLARAAGELGVSVTSPA